MKLSLIDLSPIPRNGNRNQAIRNTVDTAQHAEQWGYSRIWLAEHHNTASFAGRAPEVLIPLVAASTTRIKVGSGSVLLNHYSPFKVAEVFNTLEEMFPGRIDMGIGRATTGPVSDLALQRNRSYRQTSDDSAEQLAELHAWLNDDFDKGHPFHQVRVHKDHPAPSFWLLGSSPWSASAAAEMGLKYAFAGFINPAQAYAITQRYRQQFKPSGLETGIPEPRLILSLSVYCAETEEAAARMAAPMQLMMQRMMQGDVKSPVESEEEAVRILGGLPEIERLEDARVFPRYLIGTPATLKPELEKIAAAFDTDELMIQCITAEHASRLRSLQLLSEAFNLQA
jgi:luciferase family oxidoreductase group 1